MKTNILQMMLRILGMIQIALGIVVWIGNLKGLITPHIILGLLFTASLLGLVYQAYRAEISKWLLLVASIWAIGLPVWGLAQNMILPGTNNWISEVLHLLCGLGAIGIGEILAVVIGKKA